MAALPDGSKFIVNVEDESSKVKQEELEKSYGYKTLLTCRHWIPVLTVITTMLPLEYVQKGFTALKLICSFQESNHFLMIMPGMI